MKYIRFLRYLIPFWKIEVIISILGSVSMALGLVNPYLTKLIIDKAYKNKDLKLFISLVLIAGAVFILNGIFKGLSDYLNRYVRLRARFDLERRVFRKLQRLPYGFFQDTSTGEHLYKISYDIERATQFVIDLIPQFILLIPKSLFIFIIILYLNPKMALFSLLLMPFLFIGTYYFTFKLRKAVKVWIENSQGVFKKLQEILSHIHLVKAFGKQKTEIKTYIKILIQNFRIRLKNLRLERKGSFVNNLANRVVLGLIIFYGGYQVITEKMTLGSLSAITIYLSQLSGLQNSLLLFFQQMPEGLVSCERLDEIFNRKPEITEDRFAKEIILPRGDIEFRDVIFGYKPERKVLDNLSFSIRGGSCVALTGPSGCGKTTIVSLILRLFRPLKGGIIIDGSDINTIKSFSLYNQIGVALQEPYLWNDTVGNNIRYGTGFADFMEAEEAAGVACIDSFINGLPEKYNTVIGENACKISEGQKQRIAIARAIIKRPKILILDEALSSVDAELEGQIIDNIKNSLSGSTIIVISHRLSTIKRMDLVYFLKRPDKIYIDEHEALLKNNIEYQNYLSQHLFNQVTRTNF